MTKLSVIIPVYNSNEYLRKCLDSVLSQKNTDLEVIIINDGSNDGSEKTVSEYADKDSRILLINQENRGIPFSRNKGLSLATGEYILFIDADDYIAPDSLQRIVKEVDENTPDILQVEFYGKQKNNLKRMPIHPVRTPISGIKYFETMIKNRCLRIAPYANILKREFVESLSFRFDEEMTRMQDFEYYTKAIIKADRVMNLNFPYYYFRIDSGAGNTQERQNIRRLFSLYALILEKFDNFTKNEKLSNSVHKKLMWLVCSQVYFYNLKLLDQLDKKDRKFWKSFIIKHMFSNAGWIRPYVWQRYLHLLKL
jgi:glycosyltransferase involved in cell wall biosynthesis